MQQIFYKCGREKCFTFTFIRPVKVNIVYWDIILWQAGRRIFFCFTYIYHQTAIIKFQCQMRRGEYVNYITHRGVHTGQSNSVARSHILNLSMNESIFTDRDTEIYVICMSLIFYFDTHRFCYLHYHKMLRYVLK